MYRLPTELKQEIGKNLVDLEIPAWWTNTRSVGNAGCWQLAHVDVSWRLALLPILFNLLRPPNTSDVNGEQRFQTFIDVIVRPHGEWCRTMQLTVHVSGTRLISHWKARETGTNQILELVPHLQHLQIRLESGLGDSLAKEELESAFRSLLRRREPLHSLQLAGEGVADLFLKLLWVKNTRSLHIRCNRIQECSLLSQFKGEALKVHRVVVPSDYFVAARSGPFFPNELKELYFEPRAAEINYHLCLLPHACLHLKHLRFMMPCLDSRGSASTQFPLGTRWPKLEFLSVICQRSIETVIPFFQDAPNLKILQLASLHGVISHFKLLPFFTGDDSGQFIFPSLERLDIQDSHWCADAFYVALPEYCVTSDAQLSQICSERGIVVRRFFDGEERKSIIETVRKFRDQDATKNADTQ
jgi:hypothetical protein